MPKLSVVKKATSNNEAENYSSKSVLSSHKGGQRGGSNLLQFNQDCVHTRQVNTAQGC